MENSVSYTDGLLTGTVEQLTNEATREFRRALEAFVPIEFSYDNPLGQVPTEVQQVLDTICVYGTAVFKVRAEKQVLQNFLGILRGNSGQ
jgi:hypothetical protein